MRFGGIARQASVAFAGPASLLSSTFTGGTWLPTQSSQFLRPSHISTARVREVLPSVMKLPAPVAQDKSAVSIAGPTPCFAQCMLRVSDPDKSRDFYEGKLGMKFLARIDVDDAKFSLLFFAYTDDEVPDPSLSRAERSQWLWSRPYPTIELTYNWDSDEAYVNGNDAGLGFSYNNIVVENAKESIDRLDKAGVTVLERASLLHGVTTHGIVQDPDGYWWHIMERSQSSSSGTNRGLVGRDPLFSYTLLRVSNPDASIAFFQKLGMKYILFIDFPEASFSSYFLSYTDVSGPSAKASSTEKLSWLIENRGSGVELKYYWRDENEPLPKYCNGNQQGTRGFGHVGILVDDCGKVTKHLEEDGYKVVRKAGPFKDVAVMSFVASPVEEYWVELIERSGN